MKTVLKCNLETDGVRMWNDSG